MKIKLFKRIEIYDEVTSTLDVAKQFITQNNENFLIIAKNQTSGYGRKGTYWYSPENGIWMTAGFKFLNVQPNFNLFMGIILHKVFSKIYPNISLKIKWPNDIYANNKKVAGTVSSFHPRYNYLLFGIGINSNVEKICTTLQDKATSLFIESGSIIANELIIEKIWNSFEQNLNIFLKEKFNAFRPYYLKNSFLINKKIKVKNEKNSIEGKVKDISENGDLILEISDKKIIKINSGEIIFNH